LLQEITFPVVEFIPPVLRQFYIIYLQLWLQLLNLSLGFSFPETDRSAMAWPPPIKLTTINVGKQSR